MYPHLYLGCVHCFGTRIGPRNAHWALEEGSSRKSVGQILFGSIEIWYIKRRKHNIVLKQIRKKYLLPGEEIKL